MKIIHYFCSLVFVLVVSMNFAYAEEYEHCNSLLEHGITDITRYKSAEHAIAYKWHSNCGIDYDSTSDSRVRRASLTIFGRGNGDAGNNSAHERQRLKKWCNDNQQFAQSRNDLFEESQTISEPALLAWNQCQEIAKKNVNIKFIPQGENAKFVHFEIDSTLDSDLRFYGVKAVNYSCDIQMTDNLGKTVDVKNNPAIKNANIQIDCERQEPTVKEKSGAGRMKYDEAYLSVNTSGPALPVAFSKIVEDYFVTPPGAGLAFSGSCPNGWQPYNDAAGRFILGAGHGEELTSRSRGQLGGAEKHKLTTKEMPSHKHQVSEGRADTSVGGSKLPYITNVVQGAWTTEAAGGNKSHNNMPPYLVLQYCIKR